jgi:hypothetical protein
MQLSVDLTKADYAAFRRFALFRHRKIWLVYVAVGVFVAWTSFPEDYAAGGGALWSALVAVGLMGTAAAGLAAFAGMVLMALLPDGPRAILGEHLFTLTDSEFREVNAAGSTLVKLDLLRRRETAKHVFLITPTHVSFILPKRALDSAPEFRQLLTERTKS